MSYLRRIVKEKLTDVEALILEGSAQDFVEYQRRIARRSVLKELLNDAEEHDVQLASGQIKEDDDD